ncbi:conserved protein of unknown function [Mycoplasma capricolum subsp. capripneumoniae]|nr:conserved protein of unknown function [Mycoplasma capricolum subsp. capripneumoniae]
MFLKQELYSSFTSYCYFIVNINNLFINFINNLIYILPISIILFYLMYNQIIIKKDFCCITQSVNNEIDWR